MSIIGFEEFIPIILFLIPGYFTISMVNIFTDYLQEKYTIERTMNFLTFSFLCYLFALITFIVLFLILMVVSIDSSYSLSIISIKNYINRNLIGIIILAFVYSFPLGFFLGNYYFKKHYPFKIFRKFTRKTYSPSIYAQLERKCSKKGGFLTFHLRDGNILIGRILKFDRDEDARDYAFLIDKAIKYYPNKEPIELKGEKITINTKDTYLIEFSFGES